MKGEGEIPNGESPSGGSFSSRRRFAFFGWRPAMLLGFTATLVVAVVGGGVYRTYQSSAREVPEIILDGVDPEIAEAIRAARQSVERAPRSGKAWGQLGMTLHAHFFEDQADVCYAFAGELDKRNAAWPYLRGYIRSEGYGGHAGAVAHYERAASLSPTNSAARLRLADALLEQGRLHEADEEYRKVLAADNNDAGALYGLGRLAVAGQDYERSLRFLQPIVGSPLVQRRVCLLLANVHEQLGDSSAANRERQRLAELSQDTPRSDDPVLEMKQKEVGIGARLTKADLLMREGRIGELVDFLRETTDRHPTSDLAWHNLGMSLSAAGQPEEAERALEQSIVLSPRSATYRSSLGMLQLRQKRHEDAAQTLRKTIELRPTDGLAYFGLGECLQALGDLTGAEQAYRQALEYSADPVAARQRLEKLHN